MTVEMLRKEVPQCPVSLLEATYLPWVDIRATGRTGEQLEEELIRSHKVWVNCGEMYGTEGYVRLNIACPRSVLAEGLRRFTEGIKSILSSTGLA